MTDAAAARASALLDVGRVSEAIAVLVTALSETPGSCGLLCLLSSAHLRAGACPEALEAARHAIAADPQRALGYCRAVEALNSMERSREAVEIGTEAVRLEPTSWVTHAALATALAHRARWALTLRPARGAMAEARKAVKLAPDTPDAWFALGYCAGAVGRRRQARAAYERALSLQPDNARALHNLSLVRARRRPIAGLRALKGVAADGRTGALARLNIVAIGMYLMTLALLGAFILCTVLGMVDGSFDGNRDPRSTYEFFDWGGLLLMTAVAGIAVVRLPRAVRAYYRDQVRTNLWFGLELLLMAVAFAALACSALLASAELRSALRQVTYACLAGSFGVTWQWRRRARASLGRT